MEWLFLISFVLQHSVYDPSTICFPQRDFAIGIAVAGLILMLIVICAILCLVNNYPSLCYVFPR